MIRTLDRDPLRAACFAVARNTMWDRRPVDVASIETVADRLFSIAVDHGEFVQEQKRDPNLISRAVLYLSHIHAIPPMRDDTTWFSDMLTVLIELACPNALGSRDLDSFYRDIEDGITCSRGNFQD
jgi:hypothetical protein